MNQDSDKEKIMTDPIQGTLPEMSEEELFTLVLELLEGCEPWMKSSLWLKHRVLELLGPGAHDWKTE